MGVSSLWFHYVILLTVAKLRIMEAILPMSSNLTYSYSWKQSLLHVAVLRSYTATSLPATMVPMHLHVYMLLRT